MGERRAAPCHCFVATLVLSIFALVRVIIAVRGSGPALDLPRIADSAHGLVQHDRYLVQATNAYGGYSNMRMSLLRSLALATYLNRTAVYAPLGNCLNDESLEHIFDLSQFQATPMPANIKPTCVPDPKLASSMLVRNECPGDYICGREKAAPRVRYLHPEVYFTGGFNWRPRYPTANGTWGLHDIAAVANTEPSRCIALQEGLYFRMSPSDITAFTVYYQEAITMLLPAREIEEAAQAFLARHHLRLVAFAAIHLRLTDIGGKNLNGLGCSANISDFVTAVRSHGRMPVVLATDDESSGCTQMVIEQLKPIMVRSHRWLGERSCKEAAFVQEVLAHSSVFVGVQNSTFSAAVEGIRLLRHRRRIRGRLFIV